MKKLFLITAMLLLSQSSLLAQNPSSVLDRESITNSTLATTKLDSPAIEKVAFGVPIIKFKEIVHDFGNIRQNVPAECVFEFTNTGSGVIALENVKAGCGCTVPTWDKNPVEAGKTGKITAVYNSLNAGYFTKSITVTFSNGTIEYLTIKGSVEVPPLVAPSPVTIPASNTLITPN